MKSFNLFKSSDAVFVIWPCNVLSAPGARFDALIVALEEVARIEFFKLSDWAEEIDVLGPLYPALDIAAFRSLMTCDMLTPDALVAVPPPANGIVKGVEEDIMELRFKLPICLLTSSSMFDLTWLK